MSGRGPDPPPSAAACRREGSRPPPPAAVPHAVPSDVPQMYPLPGSDVHLLLERLCDVLSDRRMTNERKSHLCQHIPRTAQDTCMYHTKLKGKREHRAGRGCAVRGVRGPCGRAPMACPYGLWRGQAAARRPRARNTLYEEGARSPSPRARPILRIAHWRQPGRRGDADGSENFSRFNLSCGVCRLY